MSNLVEIIISGKNLAGPAINEAKGQAMGLGGGFTTAAVVAGAAAALIVAKSVEMASQFQSAMEMIHTQAGIPQAAIAGLSQQVLNLAGVVGFAPDSLADALYHIESSFASMPGQLNAAGGAMNVLKIAAEGAAVGHSDLVDTTNALDAAIAAGIPGVQNMNQAMGALNATVGSGDMKMQDLANAFSTGMVATVKGYGLSIQDVGAALATFGDNNMRGAVAATNLRMAVQAMAAPAKLGAGEFKNLSLSTTQLRDDMQKGGLLQALDDLQAHFTAAGVTATTMGGVITEMFGKKAGTGINILMEQLNRVQSKYPEIQAAMDNFSGDVAANNDTLSQKTKQLSASFQALMIELGQLLLPVVTRITDAFRVFATWLVNHQTAAKALAIVLGGVLLMAIIAITVALWNMAVAVLAATWPVLLIIAIIGLLVLAVVEIIKHFNDFKTIALDVWHAVSTAAGDAANWVRDRWDDLMRWFESIPRSIEVIGASIWQGFTHGLKEALNWIIDRINDFTSFLSGAWDWIPGTQAIPHIPHLAAGGPASGLTRINEQGGELVRLPNGSTVMPAANSQQMMSSAPAYGAPAGIGVSFEGDLSTVMATAIMRMVRENKIRLAVINKDGTRTPVKVN